MLEEITRTDVARLLVQHTDYTNDQIAIATGLTKGTVAQYRSRYRTNCFDPNWKDYFKSEWTRTTAKIKQKRRNET